MIYLQKDCKLYFYAHLYIYQFIYLLVNYLFNDLNLQIILYYNIT